MENPERTDPPPSTGSPSPGALVTAAATGDQDAWNALVDRFAGLVYGIARGFRLSPMDAADVSQTTWLKLVEHLGRLQDPERVGAWLATTARRECLRVLRHAGRQLPTDDAVVLEAPDPAEPPVEARLLTAERDAALWEAFEALSDRCRLLLRVLMADPPSSYAEVSATLEMPIGSIGPTRQRCLERLRRVLAGGTGDALTGRDGPGGASQAAVGRRTGRRDHHGG